MGLACGKKSEKNRRSFYLMLCFWLGMAVG